MRPRQTSIMELLAKVVTGRNPEICNCGRYASFENFQSKSTEVLGTLFRPKFLAYIASECPKYALKKEC